MTELVASIARWGISPEMVVSVLSGSMTAYFWLVKARRERPDLKIFQLQNFRPSVRRNPDGEGRRLGLTQIETGGVLVANNSTRQNSIVRFECYLRDGHSWKKGHWGYLSDDKPPWNIGPESTISISPACFFEVPDDYETPDDLRFKIEFVTVSGQHFGHVFTLKAPEL